MKRSQLPFTHGPTRHARGKLAHPRRAVLAVTGALLLACAAPQVAGAITVSPLPGTPDAMPDTQISILGTLPADIESVSVTGAVSGPHEGHLQDYSSAEGASFLLNTPLQEGEQVLATILVRGHRPIEDSFTVAHLSEAPAVFELLTEQPSEQQHFVSQPELHPASINVTKADPGLEGDIFLAPLPSQSIQPGKNKLEVEGVGPNGPMILSPEGKLLWYEQLPRPEIAANLQLTSYDGKRALVWWQGDLTEDGYGLGEDVIANSAYETLATVNAGNGLRTDIHEVAITQAGDAYISAYESLCLPSCPEGTPPTLDSVVQEIDIRTGLVMWEWHAEGHIAESETELPQAQNGAHDPFHVNGIQALEDHRLLLSFRNSSVIDMVDQDNGRILWRLGGRHSSFRIGAGASFHFQHDPRLNGNELTMFDNEAGPPIYGPSRGLVLNLEHRKARLVKEYVRPEVTGVVAMGSVQPQPGGDVVVGWGFNPNFSEFTPSGEMVFDAEVAKGDGDYRVLRYPWSGAPATLPAGAAVRESPEQVSVYASWSGATAVSRWEVLQGPNAQSLVPVASAPWEDFETEIAVESGEEGLFEVRAIDGEGKVLATSEPFSAG